MMTNKIQNFSKISICKEPKCRFKDQNGIDQEGRLKSNDGYTCIVMYGRNIRIRVARKNVTILKGDPYDNNY